MNTQLVTTDSVRGARRLPRPARRLRVEREPSSIALRQATAADAAAIYRLIEANLAEGHLLPRSLDELKAHAPRFVVATERVSARHKETVVACAELAPLSAAVAEVRSLVVDSSARARGIGRRLVDELRRTAVLAGFDRLCAFTHDAGYFVRKGFSIVPHEWLPEKIARDCVGCALFRACGQHAVMLSLES